MEKGEGREKMFISFWEKRRGRVICKREGRVISLTKKEKEGGFPL